MLDDMVAARLGGTAVCGRRLVAGGGGSVTRLMVGPAGLVGGVDDDARRKSVLTMVGAGSGGVCGRRCLLEGAAVVMFFSPLPSPAPRETLDLCSL